jgi:hypothetical protein
MPRKIYTNSEAQIVFTGDNPIGNQINFTKAASLPNGSGCISDPIYLGSGARPSLYEWRAWLKLGATPTDNAGSVNMYFCTCTDNPKGLFWDANLGSGARVLTDIKKTRNLQHIGAITTEGQQSGVFIQTSGLVNLYSQRAALVWWNQTGGAFSASPSGEIGFTLTPVPDEIQ